MDEDGERQA